MVEDKKTAATGKPDDDDSAMSEDEIDRNLDETFPASDPPSWTLGTDHEESPDKKSDRSES